MRVKGLVPSFLILISGKEKLQFSQLGKNKKNQTVKEYVLILLSHDHRC